MIQFVYQDWKLYILFVTMSIFDKIFIFNN